MPPKNTPTQKGNVRIIIHGEREEAVVGTKLVFKITSLNIKPVGSVKPEIVPQEFPQLPTGDVTNHNKPNDTT